MFPRTKIKSVGENISTTWQTFVNILCKKICVLSWNFQFIYCSRFRPIYWNFFWNLFWKIIDKYQFYKIITNKKYSEGSINDAIVPFTLKCFFIYSVFSNVIYVYEIIFRWNVPTHVANIWKHTAKNPCFVRKFEIYLLF